MTARKELRTYKSPPEAAETAEAAVTDEALETAMIARPGHMNGPYVRTLKAARHHRPAERVFDLLAALPPAPFAKEDAALKIDADGRREA